MKKIMFVLVAILLLAGCGKDIKTSQENKTQVEAGNKEESEVSKEIIDEQKHDIVLIDNEDFKITLLNSNHERYGDDGAKDIINLFLEVENKKDRTFNILANKLSLDGVETDSMKTFIADGEIRPNEKKEITLTTYTEEYSDGPNLSLKEHLAGKIFYSDSERSGMTESFSEYITEQ